MLLASMRSTERGAKSRFTRLSALEATASFVSDFRPIVHSVVAPLPASPQIVLAVTASDSGCDSRQRVGSPVRPAFLRSNQMIRAALLACATATTLTGE